MLTFNKEQLHKELARCIEVHGLSLDEVKDNLHVVLYCDGGSKKFPTYQMGGYGVHGYVYLDEETKSNNGSTKGYPTNKGYKIGKVKTGEYKVKVLMYVDFFGSLYDCTNNVAELVGATVALSFINELGVKQYTIYGDSKYVIDGLLSYLPKWKSNGFIKADGQPVNNKEYWIQLSAVYDQTTNGEFIWVKGHNGDIGNTYADSNATNGCIIGINNLPNTNDNNISSYKDIKSQFDTSNDLSPLLTESRMLLPSTPCDYYMQYSFGSYAPASEEDKRGVLGKRIADTTISVVTHTTKDPVIDAIYNAGCNSLGCDKEKILRLDLLNQGTLYNNTKELLANNLVVNKNELVTPNKVSLVTALEEPRLVFRLLDVFDTYAHILDDYLNGVLDSSYMTQDITLNIYNEVKDKKGNVSLVPNSGNDDAVFECPISVDGIDNVLSLTSSVDLPSLVNLKRLGKLNPKVTLLCKKDEEQPDMLYYASIIEVNGESGIWAAAYSNIHFIKKKDDNVK